MNVIIQMYTPNYIKFKPNVSQNRSVIQENTADTVNQDC